MSLEAVKGGTTNGVCSEFRCEIYTGSDACNVFECKRFLKQEEIDG